MQSFLEFLQESKKKKVKPSKADFLLNQLKKKKPKVNVEYIEKPTTQDVEIHDVGTDGSQSEAIAEDEGGGAIAGSSGISSTSSQAGMQTQDVLGKFDGTINGIIDKKKKNFYLPKNVLGKKKILKRFEKL